MKLVIFGCGKIANRIAKGCLEVKEIELVGFASKDINKAREYCETYNCKQYGDYDYFLNSDVDAVYIATYNLSHYELIKKCIEHHKSVICEKPILHDPDLLTDVFDLAKKNNVTLMEALKSVFLPINIKVKELIQNKTIGNINYISAAFMRNGSHPGNHWINDLKSGGALRDLGSYCIGTLNYLFDQEPIVTSIETDGSLEHVDTTTSIDLLYGDIKGRISVSNSKDGDNSLTIVGDSGKIVVENFWKTGEAYYEVNKNTYILNEECINDFYYELKHFAYLVDNKILQSNIMSEEFSQGILTVTNSYI